MTSPALTAAPSVRRQASIPRGWARYFGYDIFISFALGPAPRGSRAYASDLARKLVEHGFTVFFSEDEAPVGGELDATLQRALRNSRVLVVVANRGTLAEPRWVRAEVEAFRAAHPRRAVVPISIGGALQDAALVRQVEPWLQHSGRIWIDESEEAARDGQVSPEVLDRLVTAPRAVRSLVRLRALTVALIAFFAALALLAWWQRNVAAEERDRAQRALLDASAQQALLLSREGRAHEGWAALVKALAQARPDVSGRLPDGFLEAALTTLIENRRGPELRFADSAIPPHRDAGDVVPPTSAFDAQGNHVAVAAGPHVAVWATQDGQRLLQVVLPFAPQELRFVAQGRVLVAQGRGARTRDDQPGAPLAAAVDLSSGAVLPLPLALCRQQIPCIGPDAEAAQLSPLSALPAFAEMKDGRWPTGRAYLALAAGPVQREGSAQGRFHLLSRDLPDGPSWRLADGDSGAELPLHVMIDDAPAEVFAVAADAPLLAASSRGSPEIVLLRIVPGSPPTVQEVRRWRAPQAGATQELHFSADGKHLRYQNLRFGTGTGVGIGRTVELDVATGAERWARGEGQVAWGRRFVALQEDWSLTQVLAGDTGATWFSVPGRPVAFDPSERMLLMWDLDPRASGPAWPRVRLLETLPLRTLATDPRGPASTRGACVDTREIGFLTLAERQRRLWNRDDWHRVVGASAAAAVTAPGAAAAAASGSAAASAPAPDDRSSLTRSADGQWRAEVRQGEAPSPPAATSSAAGGAAAACPSGLRWRLWREGASGTERQGCVALPDSDPQLATVPSVLFFDQRAAQVSRTLAAVPLRPCEYEVLDPGSGASLGRFTPSFVHGVEFQALGKDLIGVGSRDWYGATLAMQWFSLDPPLVGPVFMLADRNDGSETPNAAATARSDVLLEVTPTTGDEELTLSFAEAGRALRLDVGPRSSVLQAPPWGERLRQRLREAVREHLRAAGTPGAAGS